MECHGRNLADYAHYRPQEHPDPRIRINNHRHFHWHRPRRHGYFTIQMAARSGTCLHRYLSWFARHRHHPLDRSGVCGNRARTVRAVPLSPWNPRAQSDCGILYWRNFPCRHPKCADWSNGSLSRVIHELRSGDAPYRRATGHPPRPPGSGQPIHFQRQRFKPYLFSGPPCVRTRDLPCRPRCRRGDGQSVPLASGGYFLPCYHCSPDASDQLL